MKQFRVGQSIAIKGIVQSINVHSDMEEWVDVETVNGGLLSISIEDVVDLESLVSPKKNLVVIPQFIADWIKNCKSESDKHSLSSAIGKDVPHEVSNWLSFDDCHNEEVFARAWIEGYDVEKEKRYWVRDKRGRGMLSRQASGIIFGSSYVTLESQIAYQDAYTFTEKEIKDYDERYWAFAVPVEE